MERTKFWLSSIIKNSLFLPTKLTTAASHLRHKAKEIKSQGLVALYKDIEACSGYEDIQVMWEMIHSSSCHLNAHKNRGGNK
ncbi:hypothetical protein CASFOL_033351 [Castilleja foliolosa]|uniref:Uncharacterized protein n=1 Tax=Castilleja foliolosa TaxID=1961234 RepID=A0ABD3BZV1_9LAMI